MKIGMRRPFFVFLAILSGWVALAIWFIQSPRFGFLFKKVAARYVPGEMGVDADFSEFAIKLFPPGVSVKNPKITLRDRNVLRLPAGTQVEAERIDLNFQPFQALSGDIRIHEVVIVNGQATIVLAAPSEKIKNSKKQNFQPNFHWDELLQVRAEAVALQNTQVHLVWRQNLVSGGGDPHSQAVDFLAKSFRLSQWTGKGGLGYEAQIDLSRLRFHATKDLLSGIELPEPLRVIDELKATAHINSSGALLEELSLKAPALGARASGKIKGDLLSASGDRTFELAVQATGDLKRWAESFSSSGKSGGKASAFALDGQAAFNGRLRGALDFKLNSLRSDGQLEIQKFEFQKWQADRLILEGSWVGGSNGGEISINRGKILKAESERSGTPPETLPASGGEIELGAFKLSPGSIGSMGTPLTVPLQLKRAHIHWLTGASARVIYPLLFRASGPAELTWVPGGQKKTGRLEVKTSLSLVDFQLDNQKFGVHRPLHRILKFPKLTLAGNVLIDSEGVKPNGAWLEISKTKLKLDGKVDFKSGFDLHAVGQANLAEIGELAETQIAGEGSLGVHVHGPFSKVALDFDTDLQNALYLKMHFGHLKGRITWDDHLDRLILSGLRVVKGETAYSGQGWVDLGQHEKLDIRVKVSNGNIRDLTDVFSDMTKDFWWFPRSLAGATEADISITGGVRMNQLQVKASITGKTWDFFGERLDQVAMIAGYDQGLYYIKDFNATKHAGKLRGRISYFDPDKFFDWELHTQQLSLSDLDRLAQLDVPIRGKVFIDSVGRGPLNSIQADSKILITDVFVRGLPLPSSRASIKNAHGRIEANGSAFDGQGILELAYDFSNDNESHLRAEFKRLDFTPVLLLLNPRTIPDPEVSSYLSGSMNLNFRSGAIERPNGEFSLTEYSLAKSGTSFRLVRPVSFKISDGSFNFNANMAGNRGETMLRLQGNKGELSGTISGSLDVSIAEFLTSSLSQATGVALLDFAIGGNLRDLTLVGKGTLDGVSFRVPAVESPFENLSGSFQVRQNRIFFHDFQADLAGGRVLGEGSITVFADRYPTLALTGSLTGNKIKVPPFQFAKVRGNLDVHGEQLPYLVEGSVVVDSALLKENMLRQKSSSALKAVRYTPPPSLRRMADYPKFKLNIDVKSEGGLLVQNDLFDAELKAQVKVVNTLEIPRILGSVDVLQGKMLFKDRKFQIQSASAVFDNPTMFNPRFNLTATTDISWVKVQLYASGRAGDTEGKEQWKIELSSNPSMPESEIISLLAMGTTTSNTKKLNSTDRTVMEQGEAASLILHSLDFNREVESKTGLQIQLDESINPQQSTSLSRLQNPGNESGASPKIVIKKKLTKNIDVSYGSTVGVGASSQREVNAEVKVTPGFSVIGVWDTYEGSEAKDKQTSYGLDLKVQKRFK